MLKVEYPCREIFSTSYKNPPKLRITPDVAKKHLHDIRLQRQSQIASNINECHRIQTIHKEVYNRQFRSPPTEQLPNKKLDKIEYPTRPKQYLIPRIEYAPIIYRRAIPTFELETSSKLKPELTQYVSDLPSAISNDQIKYNRSLPPIKHDQQRHLSVSSVTSVDKRANKVYEKWPDYNHISEIVGYRINPPSSKLIASDSKLSHPSETINRSKRITSTKPKKIFPRKSIKTKTADVTPILIDRPPSPIEKKVPLNNLIKPQLPGILCPSSMIYSNRIRTRQWLLKTNFSSNTLQTLPLL